MNIAKSFDIEAARNVASSRKSFDIETARQAIKSFDIEAARNGTVSTAEPGERGIMDRIFGTLYYNGIIEGMHNMVDDDEESSFGSGLREGFKYMNPATDDVSGRHTFSDVLEEMGWEDKPDGKLNIGRGVAGFVGDVLLDPITYMNPFSAISKVVKGSGVGIDVAKQLGDIKIADNVGKEMDTVSGVVNADNLARLGGLDRTTATEIIRRSHPANDVSEEVIRQEATKLMNDFNTKILKLRQGGEDFTIGPNNLPFLNRLKIGDKTLGSFKKNLISSKKLRELGDMTIAPYYNSLAKKIRTSNLGKKFSNARVLEGIAKNNTEMAAALFHLESLMRGLRKVPSDVKDMQVATRIKEYWDGLSEADQLFFLNAYRGGAFKDAIAFKNLRASIAQKVGASAADDISNIKNVEAVDGVTPEVEKVTAPVDEKLMGEIQKFLDGKSKDIQNSFRNAFLLFGDSIKNSPAPEFSKYINLANKLKNVSPRDLMIFHREMLHGNSGTKLSQYLTDDTAYQKLLKLNNAEKTLLMKSYSDRVTSPLKMEDLTTTYDDILRAIDPELADEILGKVADDVSAKAVDEISENVAKTTLPKEHGEEVYKTLFSRFGEEGLEIAELFSKRMDEVGFSEAARHLEVIPEQVEVLSGRYLPAYLNEEARKALQEHFKEMGFGSEKVPGSFNPEVLGDYDNIMFNLGLSEADDRVASLARRLIGKDVAETDLATIYLKRTLDSNRLIFSDDVMNYIAKNFVKPLKVDEAVEPGNVAAISYKKLNRIFHIAVTKEVKDLKRAGQKPPSKDKIYKKLVDEFFEDNPSGKVTFTPNMPIQELTDAQRTFLNDLPLPPDTNVRVSQMSREVLKRTNVMGRAQQVQLGNDMLNLYDRFVNLWKLNNTIVHPGFHLQNSISNMFQSYLGIGADALNPNNLKIAQEIFRNPDPKQTRVLNGKEYTYQELNHMMKKYGVIDEMFHTYEFKDGDLPGVLSRRGLPRGLDPTDVEGFVPYKWGTKIGTAIEGTQRANLFMSALDQGKTPEQAAELVENFLFDYSALTDFEQNVMKRIIPFYTFMRKNVPMELEQMLEQPTTFTTLQKAYNNVEKSGDNEYVDENHRSEWRQEHVQLPFDINGQTYGVSDQLPYNQLERVFDFNKLLGQTTPLVKTPIETLTGKYVYTGMDIESPKDYLLNQTFWTKMPNIAKNYEDPTTRKLYILGQLLGMPIGEINKQWE